jgi:hypothetical protein
MDNRTSFCQDFMHQKKVWLDQLGLVF